MSSNLGNKINERGSSISALFFTLIQGALGEESGWRGDLLPAVEEKLGVVKGSLIVALIWSFWHAPIYYCL
ncbi:MAG: CPBP family intramembrane metalloprotease [Anaerolineaceae bacterium]|nr:MAG: CPBP family intramembrane metalloprotease [Anaerolineaceae bacterium]